MCLPLFLLPCVCRSGMNSRFPVITESTWKLCVSDEGHKNVKLVYARGMYLISNRFSASRNGPLSMLGQAPNTHDPADVRMYSVSRARDGQWMLDLQFQMPAEQRERVRKSAASGNYVELLYPIYQAATQQLLSHLDRTAVKPLYVFPKCNSNPALIMDRAAILDQNPSVSVIVFSCPVERRRWPGRVSEADYFEGKDRRAYA